MPLSHPPKNALIIGASGGIGAAITQGLLADPRVHQVHATAREATGLASRLGANHSSGNRLTCHELDITDEQSIRQVAAGLTDQAIELDWIFCATGILHDQSGSNTRVPERRLVDVEPQTLMDNFSVNSVGPLLVAKHFSSLLPRTERAVFSALSARVGSIGDNRLGGWYSYRASKAALNMLIRNLSIELARRHRGLICTALHPGTVDTGLSRPFQAKVPAGKLFDATLAASQLLDVLDGLTADDNGQFFAWDGQPVPW